MKEFYVLSVFFHDTFFHDTYVYCFDTLELLFEYIKYWRDSESSFYIENKLSFYIENKWLSSEMIKKLHIDYITK